MIPTVDSVRSERGRWRGAPLCQSNGITPRWCRFTHRRAWSDWSSRGISKWTWNLMSLFTYSEGSSPATGSESNVYFLSIPAAKSRTQTSQKTGPVPNTWCYKSPDDFKTQVCRFQCCSGFSSCFFVQPLNYLNHRRRQSVLQILVHRICILLYMLWYTTLVLTKVRTSFVCWCPHLWREEDMSAPLVSLCCCFCGKALHMSFLKSLKSLRCCMSGVQCKQLPQNCEPFCKLEAFQLLLLLF